MRRSFVALSGTVAAAAVLAGCGSSASGGGGGGSSASTSSSGPFRILDITSLTGPIGAFGASELQGLRAAVNVLNAKGGVNGHKVEVTVKDDGSDPTTGVTLLDSAISSGPVPNMVFVGVTGSDGLAMAPIAAAHQIINWSGAPADALGEPSKSPYTFLVNPSYEYVGVLGAQAVWAKGYKTVATITSNDQPGSDELAGFKQEFTKLGGRVVGTELFSPTQTSFTALFTRAYASHPAATFVMNEGQGVPEILGHYTAGVSTPMVCDTGCVEDYSAQVGGLTKLQNVYATVPGTILFHSSSQRTPAQTTYVNALEKVGGDKGGGLLLPALDYDAVMTTAAAAEAAKSNAGAAIKSKLESMSFGTGYGLGYGFKFSSSSHFSAANGQSDVLWTIPYDVRFNTAEHIFPVACTDPNHCTADAK